MHERTQENKDLVGKIELPGNKQMPHAYVFVPKDHPLAKRVTRENIRKWEITSSQVIVIDGPDRTEIEKKIDPNNDFKLKTKIRDLPLVKGGVGTTPYVCDPDITAAAPASPRAAPGSSHSTPYAPEPMVPEAATEWILDRRTWADLTEEEMWLRAGSDDKCICGNFS
jgi:hypothetical protein